MNTTYVYVTPYEQRPGYVVFSLLKNEPSCPEVKDNIDTEAIGKILQEVKGLASSDSELISNIDVIDKMLLSALSLAGKKVGN